MSTRKRVKPNTIIPSSPENPSQIKNKPERLTTNHNNNHIESQCCGIISNFIKPIVNNFVIPSFAANIIGCIITTYYLNYYFQTNKSYLQRISYLIVTLCAISAIILHSYLYLVIALMLSPHGQDINSYSVGRGRFHPHRVYLFICTCFQEFFILSYFNSYFYCISRYLNKCKRISPACDLNKMEYNDYSIHSLKRIISNANNQCLEAIENKQRLERVFLKQTHYDNIVKQDINHIIKFSQTNAQEMISIFNVHFDENNPKQYAHIFLPPSLTMNSLNCTPTPAIIFLVGGAWGSCDISFSASAASSFVNSKIAFIYPKYTVYPEGNVQDILSNINAIIKWTIKYSSALNINPNHLCIVGQSSGAHLSALAILKAYQEKSKWLRRVRLYCGLAGPYCIRDHYRWESSRGIENVSPMARCMKGIPNFGFYSPSIILQELYTSIVAKYMNDMNKMENELKQMSESLPYFLLIHCVNDYVVPISSSRKFKHNLDKINVKCEFEEYQNGNHHDTLFGLCDVNNCLFNRLITDITSRIFICCKQYNKAMQMMQLQQTEEKEEKEEKVDEDIYNLADIDEEDEEYDESSFDLAQNENNENENGNDVKEEECKDEMEEQQCSNENDNENKIKLKSEEIDDDWIDVNYKLFKHDDISMDVNKSDEAIEFMKNLVSDMDKALDQISSLNNNTKGQIDEFDKQKN